jgi:hypothetical protein
MPVLGGDRQTMKIKGAGAFQGDQFWATRTSISSGA